MRPIVPNDVLIVVPLPNPPLVAQVHPGPSGHRGLECPYDRTHRLPLGPDQSVPSVGARAASIVTKHSISQQSEESVEMIRHHNEHLGFHVRAERSRPLPLLREHGFQQRWLQASVNDTPEQMALVRGTDANEIASVPGLVKAREADAPTTRRLHRITRGHERGG